MLKSISNSYGVALENGLLEIWNWLFMTLYDHVCGPHLKWIASLWCTCLSALLIWLSHFGERLKSSWCVIEILGWLTIRIHWVHLFAPAGIMMTKLQRLGRAFGTVHVFPWERGRSATACSFSLQIMILLERIRQSHWKKSGKPQQICDVLCIELLT